MFLGFGAIAQYVAPQYGIPVALAVAATGFVLIYRSNRESNLEASNSSLLTVDNAGSSPDYSKEWEHFDKINDAIIRLQSATIAEASELTNLIQRERVYLDDSNIQDILDKLVFEVDQWAKIGVTPDSLSPLIPLMISRLSSLMHKRYKRSLR